MVCEGESYSRRSPELGRRRFWSASSYPTVSQSATRGAREVFPSSLRGWRGDWYHWVARWALAPSRHLLWLASVAFSCGPPPRRRGLHCYHAPLHNMRMRRTARTNRSGSNELVNDTTQFHVLRMDQRRSCNHTHSLGSRQPT